LRKEPRPRGILILMYFSVIFGGLLTYAGFQSTPETEKQIMPEIIPGYTLGFLQVLGYILITIGIMYIGMGIGFWKGNVWALKLYKYVNYSITTTTIFYGALINNPTGGSPLNQIITQLSAITYSFVVNRYLHKNKHVLSYFGSKSPVNGSKSPVSGSESRASGSPL
jgi:hypothetical protein